MWARKTQGWRWGRKELLQDTTERSPWENQFILSVLGHRKQCKARPMTPSPVCCLHVVIVCHLHDAYVSLQDFFVRVFFGRDKLWRHSHTLALVVDQHVLLVRGVPWVTCRQRTCSPGPRREPLKPALAAREVIRGCQKSHHYGNSVDSETRRKASLASACLSLGVHFALQKVSSFLSFMQLFSTMLCAILSKGLIQWWYSSQILLALGAVPKLLGAGFNSSCKTTLI